MKYCKFILLRNYLLKKLCLLTVLVGSISARNVYMALKKKIELKAETVGDIKHFL